MEIHIKSAVQMILTQSNGAGVLTPLANDEATSTVEPREAPVDCTEDMDIETVDTAERRDVDFKILMTTPVSTLMWIFPHSV